MFRRVKVVRFFCQVILISPFCLNLQLMEFFVSTIYWINLSHPQHYIIKLGTPSKIQIYDITGRTAGGGGVR